MPSIQNYRKSQHRIIMGRAHRIHKEVKTAIPTWGPGSQREDLEEYEEIKDNRERE